MSKSQKTFDFLLKDFEPNLHYKDTWIGPENGTRTLERYHFDIPKELKFRHTFMIYLMFVKIKGFEQLGRFEKTLWEIPILYKGLPFVLAHKKFGFTFSASSKFEDFENLSKEALIQMHKAIPFTEELISPVIHEKLISGKVTIESNYTKLRNRYQFFRTKALEQDSMDDIKVKELRANFKIDDFLNEEYYDRINMYSNSRQYYLLAMIDAYFSWLEHISVLLIPFVKNINIESMNLESFMLSNWKTKLRILLQHKTNNSAAKYLEILDEIKEQIRNPASHGDFYKNGHSFYVHMEGVGAIPFSLTKSSLNFKFSDISKSVMTFQNIINHFDDFDEHLKSSEFGFGLLYISKNLPVAFDKKSVSSCRRRTKTEKSTLKYIDDTIRDMEIRMNMDW